MRVTQLGVSGNHDEHIITSTHSHQYNAEHANFPARCLSELSECINSVLIAVQITGNILSAYLCPTLSGCSVTLCVCLPLVLSGT